MNFEQWDNKILYKECNHDLQPDEAGEMGWFACKREVLKILKDNRSKEIFDPYNSLDNAIEKIEKL